MRLEEELASKEYIGRFIVILQGQDGKNNYIVYGVTSRSPPGRARKLVYDDKFGIIRTEVTDKEQLEKGNQALLIYPAIVFAPFDSIIVSNGAQTNLIYSTLLNKGLLESPAEILISAFRNPYFVYDSKNGWVNIAKPEPDNSSTPRISAFVRSDKAVLHIIRMINNNVSRDLFPFTLERSKGKLLSTYKGINLDPIPRFDKDPIDVEIETTDHEDLANKVYKALAPNKPNDTDFRVSVAVVSINRSNLEKRVAIINRDN